MPDVPKNGPINFRLPKGVRDALEAYRQQVADRSEFEPPARSRIIVRAVEEFLTTRGFPCGGAGGDS